MRIDLKTWPSLEILRMFVVLTKLYYLDFYLQL